MGFQDHIDEDDFENAIKRKRQRRSVVFGGLGVIAVLVTGWKAAAWWAGNDPTNVVEAYLDAVVSGERATKFLGPGGHQGHVRQIDGMIVRGFEIKNTSGNVVSATVTYESRAGTDLPKTLRFTVEGGQIVDIR